MGLPPGCESISISRQPTPLVRVPRTFMSASLPAKRAASAGTRPRQSSSSASVYIRRRKRSLQRATIRLIRDISIMSIPVRCTKPSIAISLTQGNVIPLKLLGYARGVNGSGGDGKSGLKAEGVGSSVKPVPIYGSIHQADGLVQVGKGKTKPPLPQLAIPQPLVQPPPGHPAHLVIKGRPVFSPTVGTIKDKVTNNWIEGFHKAYLEGLN